MTKKNEKPREFELTKTADGKGCLGFSVAIDLILPGESVRFIEHSFYEKLKRENEKLREALSFYASEDAWYLHKDLVTGSEIRRSIILDDTESFGFQASPYDKSILQVFGGKRARQALEETEVDK